ncbi:hypothetical protein DKT77_05325 [Meridianimarinicoccus roseus]|jgi:transposase|uniref:Uncharacterized protein n=1 Tax=Meridianimarinicoccus roseus TaxID=2072018 RepID=A0A2V2LN13_9RHOB|nr:hypothetical protein DKT77_05325 [Meridianimarinicoccus roseus]
MKALAAPLGEKMSRHQFRGANVPELLKRYSDLKCAVRRQTGQVVPLIAIQEVGSTVSGGTAHWSPRASKAM